MFKRIFRNFVIGSVLATVVSFSLLLASTTRRTSVNQVDQIPPTISASVFNVLNQPDGIKAVRAQSVTCENVILEAPTLFLGYFIWRNSIVPQVMTLVRKHVRCLNNHTLELGGISHYRIFDKQDDLGFRIIIDLRSFAFQMMEIAPHLSDWDTSSVYVGQISTDLRRVSAIWESRESSDIGDLVLIGQIRSRNL